MQYVVREIKNNYQHFYFSVYKIMEQSNNAIFTYKIDDTFVNYNTRSLLCGKEINNYNKKILFEVIKYYNNKDIKGDTETKRKIISYLHDVFQEKDLNYDKLMRKFNAQTNECLLAYVLIAYKNDRLDLILRCMYTFGRVLPLRYETEWFDNYRLNNYGNPLNMVMWKKYDCDDVYSVNEYEPKPINRDVKLPYGKVIKFLVGSLRAFIIDHNLYPGSIRNNSNEQQEILSGGDIEALISSSNFAKFRDGLNDKHSRNLTGEQICDECYEHYPFYFGGAHGCDVFDIGLSLTLEEIKMFLERYPSAHIGYILNTATYRSGKGEHWVALEFTKGKAKLICSQQSDFTVFKDGGILNRRIEQLMFGQEYNPVKVQTDSYNCGIYSALALYEMLCNNSDITKSVEAIGINGENIKPGYNIQDVRERIAGVR